MIWPGIHFHSHTQTSQILEYYMMCSCATWLVIHYLKKLYRNHQRQCTIQSTRLESVKDQKHWFCPHSGRLSLGRRALVPCRPSRRPYPWPARPLQEPLLLQCLPPPLQLVLPLQQLQLAAPLLLQWLLQQQVSLQWSLQCRRLQRPVQGEADRHQPWYE